MNLAKVVSLCRNNDPLGQKLLYERFINPMARLCTRYMKEEEDVADVLVEGFVKVFNGLKKFEYKNDQSLEAWIKKIMINQSLATLRKKRGKMLALDEVDIQGHDHEPEIAANEIIELIKMLPKGYRIIFNLSVIDGYSHKEIAQMLKISESTSRSQLAHARSKMKNILRKNGWK